MIDLNQGRGGTGTEGSKDGEGVKIEYAVKKGIRFRSPIVGDAQTHSDEEEEERVVRVRWSVRKQGQGMGSEERCRFRFYDVETGCHY